MFKRITCCVTSAMMQRNDERVLLNYCHFWHVRQFSNTHDIVPVCNKYCRNICFCISTLFFILLQNLVSEKLFVCFLVFANISLNMHIYICFHQRNILYIVISTDHNKMHYQIFSYSITKKSRIRETLNLSTDADHKTNIYILFFGWVENF